MTKAFASGDPRVAALVVLGADLWDVSTAALMAASLAAQLAFSRCVRKHVTACPSADLWVGRQSAGAKAAWLAVEAAAAAARAVVSAQETDQEINWL